MDSLVELNRSQILPAIPINAMSKKPFRKFPLTTLIAILTASLIGINIFYLGVYLVVTARAALPVYYEPGYQFLSFKDKLAGVPTIGYLSDQGMSRGKNDETFLQAQNFLAPTIIRYNESNYPFLILDSQNKNFHLSMIRTLHAKPVVHNDYGQLLVEKTGP